ncbi:berberine bridge enzyme-like 8 [Impatiens glandulifera]|uniref:berberine bridge enzyme-like 8 n=1 Tax=Impatiens glandulifera TaxID=253017 RepID=UPI001FB1686B|nr:berberine bridge enzyme-like 8 [Impatiens glandulifera]
MMSLATLFIAFIISFISLSWIVSAHSHQDFIDCLSNHFPNSSISEIIYTPDESSYLSVLNSSIQNLRFTSPSTPKPLLIIRPLYDYQIQAAISCSKIHGIQIRFRSGGHDYEGLSYVSPVTFIILDLINIRSIEVDIGSNTAWIQSGATIGQLYYSVAQNSINLAFPAGVCPTVGVGGHFSGGGYGTLLRKYGLAADNVIDARMVDVNGNILDRKTMGEDMFWAIRGGGGGSFGVILAWKVNLVSVPSIVTVFTISKTLEQNATSIINRWQYVAHKFPKELFIRIIIGRANSRVTGKLTIEASFNSLYLGRADDLVNVMQDGFPELGLTKDDLIEMNWIESILYFAGFRGQPLEILLNRAQPTTPYFKAKSDYVQEPIPQSGLEGIWDIILEDGAENSIIILSPYGGIMDEIPESSIPFPHRAGNLYKIQHLANWNNASEVVAIKRIDWIRRLYSYMTPYVSKHPRAAYLNYRDLDIGVNRQGNTSYAQASIWGMKYFKNNFKRLVKVKSMVDPSNFFWNEQSIPVLNKWTKKKGH